MYVLKREKLTMIARMAVEGASIRSIERMTGCNRDSIMRWLLRIGDHCRWLHDVHVRNVQTQTVELDEIWTFVQKKQRRVRPSDPREWGDSFTFIASARDSRLIVSYLVGDRTLEDTWAVVHDLNQRILGHTQVNTDGWLAYPNAVGCIFGNRADHGIIIKEFGKATVDSEHRYSPPRLLGMRRKRGWGNPKKRLMTTSHAERLNLSVRTSVRRFTRLSLGFSKTAKGLAAAVDLFVMWYNFCRPHKSLDGLTPAQKAGMAPDRWDIERLIPEWPKRGIFTTL